MPGIAPPAARAFEQFRRERTRHCPSDLSPLSLPVESGLVSIVLPVYNGERYLREAIESVLIQTGPPFELIVVNDGSTDRTAEILAEYANDQRVRVIHQPNQKLPRALSNGFRSARGEFLTWISADNRFKPGFLDRMTACLRRHPSWDMIYANQDIIDENGRPLRGSEWFWPWQQPLGSEHIYWPHEVADLNVLGVNFVGGAFMYRYRAYFLLGDYADDRFGLEDYDYWMRMNALLTLRHADFDEPVYDYRLHSESLTSRGDELDIEGLRHRLLTLDAARRAAWLRPLTWCLEADDTPSARRLKEELSSTLRTAGHTVEDKTPRNVTFDPTAANVCLRVASDPSSASPPPATDRSLCVLVTCHEGPLPGQMPPEWHLCVARAKDARPPRLAGERQGWLVAHDVSALCAAIDIRARCDLFDTARPAGSDGPPP